ncbi:MAG: phycobiliprotein lyase [Synechococcales cyanobacterium RM1_1_8]|nr:phycobiliprotein lyase [Synechococcales cyanobacterium RM1_1_8]
MAIQDAMEFFQRSSGQWKSQRTTHHLPFRRAESGSSSIQVEALAADHPKVIEICTLHEVDPALTIGGAHVTWNGEMEWDREGEEQHSGETVFALVPDQEDPRQGRLLRERGYAEITPVIGRYLLDDEDGLVLTTDYETMSATERFWFAGPNMRLRSSTVTRFGGLSTASFCAETRLTDGSAPAEVDQSWQETALYSSLGW